MERLYHDLRLGWRMLRKTPGFTIAAIITVAFGIAANVAVFSFIDAIFLRSLDVKDAGRLIRIYRLRPSGDPRPTFSYTEYTYLREHATTLEKIAAHYSSAP